MAYPSNSIKPAQNLCRSLASLGRFEGDTCKNVWCSVFHQPMCNFGEVKFLNEKLHIEFQAHFSTVFPLQELSLTNLSCHGIVGLKLLCPTLSKSPGVAFCSVSIPYDTISQMHLLVRLKEGFPWEMTFKLSHERKLE